MDDNTKGLVLAVSSSLFIGASFIVKKKGLRKAGTTGLRAGHGGFSYLSEPLWWAGMLSMIMGEVANFAAYAFAPAILVTPLGALSIIISAVLAHIMLKEKLHWLGVLGCALCVVGSTVIVLHAPEEREITSVREVWLLALEPGFVLYSMTVVALVLLLVFQLVPQYGQSHILVYISICSLTGSLSVGPLPSFLLPSSSLPLSATEGHHTYGHCGCRVLALKLHRMCLRFLGKCVMSAAAGVLQVMSCKAVGIAIKLTLSGDNQLFRHETLIFALVVAACGVTQITYLNKALDTFNTAVVSPIYYVMFTSFTILASVIMFKDWEHQSAAQIMSELCGFVTILAGTLLLHVTKDHSDMAATGGYGGLPGLPSSTPTRTSSNKRPDNGESLEEVPLRRQESLRASP
eukprot:SM000097S24826  [mRNA]  locus=s97:420044:422624:- [translate_table: standard]